MGRKGVSKRKPKKSTQLSNPGIGGSSNNRPDDHSPVQALIKDKSNTFNPSAGSKKTQKKH